MAIEREENCNGMTTETTELVVMETNTVTMENNSEYDTKHSTQSIFSNSPAHSGPAHSAMFLGLERQVREIRRSLQRIESKFEEKRIQEQETVYRLQEWRAIAIVLDRFFFAVYLMIITLSLKFVL